MNPSSEWSDSRWTSPLATTRSRKPVEDDRIHAGHPDQEVEGEGPADHRGQLGDRLGRAQRVEPGQKRSLEGARDLEVHQGRGQDPGIFGPDQEARLQHGPLDLLHEQGDPRGRGHDAFHDRFGQASAPGQHVDELPDLLLAQRLQPERRQVGPFPRGFELGARRDEEQNRKGAESDQQKGERVDGRGVAPVQILEQHHQRLSSAHGRDPADQHLDRPLEPELTADRGERCSRDPEQGGHQFGAVGEADLRVLELRSDAAHLGLRSRFAGQGQCVLDECHHRSEHAHLGVGGARALQPEAVVTGEVADMERQSRLADSLLAGDQHRGPLTRAGPSPATGQQVQFMVASDQGRQPAGGSLDPVVDAGAAEDRERIPPAGAHPGG